MTIFLKLYDVNELVHKPPFLFYFFILNIYNPNRPVWSKFPHKKVHQVFFFPFSRSKQNATHLVIIVLLSLLLFWRIAIFLWCKVKRCEVCTMFILIGRSCLRVETVDCGISLVRYWVGSVFPYLCSFSFLKRLYHFWLLANEPSLKTTQKLII